VCVAAPPRGRGGGEAAPGDAAGGAAKGAEEGEDPGAERGEAAGPKVFIQNVERTPILSIKLVAKGVWLRNSISGER